MRTKRPWNRWAWAVNVGTALEQWNASVLESTREPSGQTVRALRWKVLGKHRVSPHVERKLYHMAMGLSCFSIYAFAVDRAGALQLLISVGGLMIAADFFRLRFEKLNDLILHRFGKLMRREELRGFTANSYFVIGLISVTLVFPKPIVLLSVLYLALGDPAASLVGTRYGKTKIVSGKSLEGALANGAVCMVATFLFASLYLHWTDSTALFLSVLGGAIAMLSELVPVPWDDNLSIPIFSATALYLCASGITILQGLLH